MAVFIASDGSFPDPSSYDCFVIGSGPAGITTAVTLAEANRKVLLFESGNDDRERRTMPNARNTGHFRDGWWDRHSIRGLGGTSQVWSGWCASLMERDFNNPAAGVRWPIARSELFPYYRRAAPILDRSPSILDPEKPWIPGFLYRPYSRLRPTRFGARYLDLLRDSPAIHVALSTSVLSLDADMGRSAVSGLTCLRHEGDARLQLAIQPGQPANLVVIDLNRPWTQNTRDKSFARVSPHHDRRLNAQVTETIVGGTRAVRAGYPEIPDDLVRERDSHRFHRRWQRLVQEPDA